MAGRRVRWGQNFLIDPNVVRHIVDWADVDGRHVLEIGPGRGALTELLAERAAGLTLVEIDPVLAQHWREHFAADNRIEVIEGDALRIDLDSTGRDGLLVVGNLPYESGTAIVRRLLERQRGISRIVVMLQREVCARLLAQEASKHYGLLSIHTQLAADVEAGRRVGPKCFRPEPKVESQLVRITPLPVPRYDVGDRAIFDDLVARAFGQRRKMIRNSIGRRLETLVGEEAAVALLAAVGLTQDRRPETVSVETFAALSHAVTKHVSDRA